MQGGIKFLKYLYSFTFLEFSIVILHSWFFFFNWISWTVGSLLSTFRFLGSLWKKCWTLINVMWMSHPPFPCRDLKRVDSYVWTRFKRHQRYYQANKKETGNSGKPNSRLFLVAETQMRSGKQHGRWQGAHTSLYSWRPEASHLIFLAIFGDRSEFSGETLINVTWMRLTLTFLLITYWSRHTYWILTIFFPGMVLMYKA